MVYSTRDPLTRLAVVPERTTIGARYAVEVWSKAALRMRSAVCGKRTTVSVGFAAVGKQ